MMATMSSTLAANDMSSDVSTAPWSTLAIGGHVAAVTHSIQSRSHSHYIIGWMGVARLLKRAWIQLEFATLCLQD